MKQITSLERLQDVESRIFSVLRWLNIAIDRVLGLHPAITA